MTASRPRRKTHARVGAAHGSHAAVRDYSAPVSASTDDDSETVNDNNVQSAAPSGKPRRVTNPDDSGSTRRNARGKKSAGDNGKASHKSGKQKKDGKASRLADLTLNDVLHAIRPRVMLKKNMIKYGVMLAVMAVICICVDSFLPEYNTWVNILRTFLAVIAAVPAFFLGYGVCIRQSIANERRFNDEIDKLAAEEGIDPDKARLTEDGDELVYTPYRLRYSYNTRLKQSIIFVAVLACIAIVTSFSHVYTITAAFVLAAIAGCVCYCRLTNTEKFYRDNDIPDPRDIRMEEIKKDRELTQKALIEMRQKELLEEKDERDREREETKQALFGSTRNNNAARADKESSDDDELAETDALADLLQED